jgi:hypothetical protein
MSHKHAMLAPLPAPARTVVVDGVRADEQSIEAVIRVGAALYRVFFAGPAVGAGAGADPFVAIALLPALLLGAELRVEGPVAPETLEAANRVQELYVRWFPRLRPIRVEAPPRPSGPRANGVLSLFSGGVDSFYSALEGRGRLTHLLFVHGFDVPLEAEALRERVAASLRTAAAELGLPLIEMETNARAFMDPYVPWDFGHGAAIAAAAMVLSRAIGEVVIPSSGEILISRQRTRLLWGSHPELDPLWTTTEQRFVHHAADTGRQAKMRLLATSETAMRYLRVCWRNPGGAYNCGRCEKCVRTMAGLRILNAGDRCRGFTSALDPAAVRRVAISEPDIVFWRELEEAAIVAEDRPLASAIRTALRYRHLHAVVDGLRAVLRRLPGAHWLWTRSHGLLWAAAMSIQSG